MRRIRSMACSNAGSSVATAVSGPPLIDLEAVFEAEVTFERTFFDLIHDATCPEVDKDVWVVVFSKGAAPLSIPLTKIQFGIFGFDRDVYGDDARAAIVHHDSKHPWAVADLEHLLTFASLFPEQQLLDSIAALHACAPKKDELLTVFLSSRSGTRSLRVYTEDRGTDDIYCSQEKWPAHSFRFLAFRVKPDEVQESVSEPEVEVATNTPKLEPEPEPEQKLRLRTDGLLHKLLYGFLYLVGFGRSRARKA